MKSPYYTVDKLGSPGSDVTYPILHKWLPNQPLTVPDQSDLRQSVHKAKKLNNKVRSLR